MLSAFKVRSASAQDAAACASVVVDAYESLRSTELMFPNARSSRAVQIEGRRVQFAAQLEGLRDIKSTSRHHVGQKTNEKVHYEVAVDQEGAIVGLLRWSLADVQEREEKDVGQLIESVTSSKLELLGVNRFNPSLFKRFLYATATKHDQHFAGKGAHVVLHTLATLPSHQKQGIGSALMDLFTQRIDSLQLCAYLEATDAGKHLYERYGFSIVETINIDEQDSHRPGFQLHVMVRRPTSVADSDTNAFGNDAVTA